MRPAVTTAFTRMNGQSATGVELGVAFGEHAEATLRRWPNLSLWLIDNYCEGGPEREVEAHKRVAGYAVHWVRMDSSLAAGAFTDRAFDYVYIDADHTYEGVKKDLAAWYPLVRVGGVFGGHDYANHTVPGVPQAVDEFFRNTEVVISVHPRTGDWWVIKGE